MSVCQARQQKKLSKKIQQQQAWDSFYKNPDLNPLVSNLYRSLTRSNPTIAYQTIELFLQMSSNGRRIYMSQATLAKRFGKNWQSVSKVLCDMADWGMIHKKQRGMNDSNEYMLNPAFNKPVVQTQLYPFFGFLKKAAFSILLLSLPIESAQLINIAVHKIELRKIGNYYKYCYCFSYCSCMRKLYKKSSSLYRTAYAQAPAGRETHRETYRSKENTFLRDGFSASTLRSSGPQSMSSLLNNVFKPIERIPPMYDNQDNSEKKAFNVPWYKNRDPFEATKQVSSRFGKGPLPTNEQMRNLTLEEYILLQKGYIPASLSPEATKKARHEESLLNLEKEPYEARTISSLSIAESSFVKTPADRPEYSGSTSPDPVWQDEAEPIAGEDYTPYLEDDGEWVEI